MSNLRFKKITMLLIKLLVSIVPKNIRLVVKKSPKLTAFYSQSLHNSGLFYGQPSIKETHKRYLKITKNNDVFYDSISSLKDRLNISIVIVVRELKTESLALSLDSISKLKSFNGNVFFICKKNKMDELKKFVKGKKIQFLSFFSEEISSLNFKGKSAIFISDYEIFHPSILNVINSCRMDESELIYFDSYEVSESGYVSPHFYPDWDPDFQLASGYVDSGIWVKNPEVFFENIADIFRPYAIAGSILQKYVEKNELAVGHINYPLLRKCQDKTSFILNSEIIQNNRRLIRTKTVNGSETYRWELHDEPLVSIIIPTKNAKALVKTCVESILTRTTYRNFEILLVDNNSDDEQCITYFRELNRHSNITVLQFPFPFNYSAINNFAVQQANGKIIALVNNDIEVIEPNWLNSMVGHVLRPDIGCVGAKLLYPDGRVQHAGVVMGYGGGAGHAHKYFPKDHEGYLGRLKYTNSFSAVTAACLVVEKSDYIAVGGLDEENFKVAFNDVDFCLKVLELGRRNLYCADAVLYHHESVSRGLDDTKEKVERFQSELLHMQTKWASYITRDPSYNVNLTLRRENFGLKC